MGFNTNTFSIEVFNSRSSILCSSRLKKMYNIEVLLT